MKEKAWEFLIDLIESCQQDHCTTKNKNLTATAIKKAGFSNQESKDIMAWLKKIDIKKIIQWARTMSQQSDAAPSKVRIYTPDECQKITPAARNCLLQLERAGIIDDFLRETIITQAVTHSPSVVDIPEIQWATYPILFSQPALLSPDKTFLALLMLSNSEGQCH